MQNKQGILYLFFLTFISSVCLSGVKKSAKDEKIIADSLFQEKNYTKAQELYLNIYANHKIESNDILLKLALTYEGLGDISSAIFYLKKYSKENPDMDVERHIEKLGETNNLIGYTISDFEQFKYVMSKYAFYIITSLTTLAILLAVFFVVNFYSRQKKSVPLFIFSVLFTIFTFCSIYLVQDTKKAIIREKSLLMNAPSAGATLQEYVEKGHLVNIIGEKDIWFKILLEDKTFFIRKKNVSII